MDFLFVCLFYFKKNIRHCPFLDGWIHPRKMDLGQNEVICCSSLTWQRQWLDAYLQDETMNVHILIRFIFKRANTVISFSFSMLYYAWIVLPQDPPWAFRSAPFIICNYVRNRTRLSLPPNHVLGLQYSDVYLHFKSSCSISATGWRLWAIYRKY